MSLIGFPPGAVIKNPPANARESGDTGLIPGLGRTLEKEMKPTPYSSLENSMDNGARWTTAMALQRGKHDLATKHTLT